MSGDAPLTLGTLVFGYDVVDKIRSRRSTASPDDRRELIPATAPAEGDD